MEQRKNVKLEEKIFILEYKINNDTTLDTNNELLYKELQILYNK